MPFIPAQNTVKCTIQGSFRGEQYVNNLWFLSIDGVPTLVEMGNLANYLATTFVTGLLAVLSSDLSINRITVRDFTTQVGLVWEEGFTPVPGGAGDGLPNNVAACISFRTGLAGRSFRGRNMVGGIPRTEVVENSLSTGFMNSVRSPYVAMVGAGAVVPGWIWVVASFYALNVPRASAVITPITDALFVDSTVDSMRRRLPGRGR